MYRALMVTEAPLGADELRQDLKDSGVDIVSENSDPSVLATAVVRCDPDLVIAASTSPSNVMFEAARLLGTLAPCPFIMFTSDSDTTKIEKASDSGIHAYIINGYAKHRLLSIIQVARARFRHDQVLKEELTGLSQRFEERKIVDRAKGVLMRSRGIAEEEAFELLRNLAMNSRQRIGVIAQSVIDMSRAGEAVNRAGQLRMLSQRIVKCYAQCLVGIQPEEAVLILSDSIARVDANLGILHKAISTKGYGDLVDRVTAKWVEVRKIGIAKPDLASIEALDASAEKMLAEAEHLTEFLESSGLVPSLRILNISGRQRMLSQRITKLCFLLAINPEESRLTQLRVMATTFQEAMEYLNEVPLSSVAIRNNLESGSKEWKQLSELLDSIGEAAALEKILDASEKLLDVSERLTEQYEQVMQVLIGDRLGHIV